MRPCCLSEAYVRVATQRIDVVKRINKIQALLLHTHLPMLSPGNEAAELIVEMVQLEKTEANMLRFLEAIGYLCDRQGIDLAACMRGHNPDRRLDLSQAWMVKGALYIEYEALHMRFERVQRDAQDTEASKLPSTNPFVTEELKRLERLGNLLWVFECASIVAHDLMMEIEAEEEER